MEKYTRVELDLMTDFELTQFIIKNIRGGGGLSQCNLHYANEDNKYITNYNTAERSFFFVELDEHNLYSAALYETLPLPQVPDDGLCGYLVEADMRYPRHIHDQHANLPFLIAQYGATGWQKNKKSWLICTTKISTYTFYFFFESLLTDFYF